MKKFILVVLILGALVGGYFGYQKWFTKTDVSPWSFVPKTAALVMELDQVSVFDSIQTETVWSAFSGFESVASLNEFLTLKSDDEDASSIGEAFGLSKMMLAIFPVSTSGLDVLMITPWENKNQLRTLENLVDKYVSEGFKRRNRKYNGFTIEELYKPDGKVFSYFVKDNFLVGSFTPFLVEDAVRTFNDGTSNFAVQYPDPMKLNPLNNDQGNIYVNFSQFGELLEVFAENGNLELSGSAFLDFKVLDNGIQTSGFSFPEQGMLAAITTPAQSFNLLDIVPNSAALVQHFSVTNPENWRQELKSRNKEVLNATIFFEEQFDLNIDQFFVTMESEIALIHLESFGSDRQEMLLVFDSNDISASEDLLRHAASRTAEDSVFTDRIGDYEIGRIGSSDFPAAFLGNGQLFGQESYYLILQNYVILSSSISQLKGLVAQIESDDTWRKSIRVNNLLEASSREANYSLIVNIPRYWNVFKRNLKPEWREVFSSNEVGLKSLEYLALQFSKVDDKFYTTLAVTQPQAPKQVAKSQVSEELSLPFPIITKPFIHRSHVNQEFEVLVQDSSYSLYHLSNSFGIIWSKELNGPLQSSIQAVDYYNNGKKQYAFVVNNELHIIDREGNYVETFPETIPAKSAVKHFSVVDYDGSKNYRFMCSTDRETFLLDKQGKVLGGWNPLSHSNDVKADPRHVRVAAKDAFVVLHQRSVDLKNRRGESYAGFPVQFESNLSEGYFTVLTASFNTSFFTLLTQEGELIKLNFSGKIQGRTQLYRPDVSTSFDLIPDVLGNTFLISRTSNLGWQVLDADGNELFSKPYIKEGMDVKFYRFGGGHTIISVQDFEQNLISMYDLDGTVITQTGISSANPVSILYFENQGAYEVYLTNGNSVSKMRIK